MSRPFEYRWTSPVMGRRVRAYEAEPGVIIFYESDEQEGGRFTAERKVDKPCGLTNELVQLVLDARKMRCDLAAAGVGPSACSECDDYDPEAIAACPHCQKPVCDACMHNWHQNGTLCSGLEGSS